MRKLTKRKQLQHKLSSLLIGIFVCHFLVLHGGLSEFVLCIGSDGHIAVERSTDDATCSDEQEISHQTAIEQHNEKCCTFDAPHCGDCRDFSLTSDCRDAQALTSQKQLKIPSSLLLAVTDFITHDCAMKNLKFSIAITPNTFQYPAQASLRSTILLI